MTTKEELIDVRNYKKKGCVAYGEINGQAYLALNGEATSEGCYPKGFIDKIRGIIHRPNAKFVGITGAKSFIDYNKNIMPDNKMWEDYFCDLFSKNYSSICIEVLEHPIVFDENNSDHKSKSRYWGCAEKKLYSNYSGFDEVRVTQKPCYYCLPAIESKVFFLEGDDLYLYKMLSKVRDINKYYEPQKCTYVLEYICAELEKQV